MKKGIFFAILMIILQLDGYGQESTSAENINNIPVFIYHRVGDSRYPSTNISTEVFEMHLKYLQENGYEVITLGTAVDFIEKGNSAPERTAVLSIDDGYTSFLENGFPLLKEYGFPATLFINTKQVGGKGFIGWEGLKMMRENGIEIANHSHSHDYFVNRAGEELVEEFTADLETSHKIFKEKLGFVPDIYSFPFGEYTPEMQQILKDNGYRAAAGQHSGVISEYSELYNLPRFPMTGIYATKEKFIERVKMHSLPAKALQQYPILKNGNPPKLQVKLLQPDLINNGSLQCFVAGSQDCKLEYDTENQMITFTSEKKLSARRSLYTITAQSADNPGQWYWWSWLWIQPEVEE